MRGDDPFCRIARGEGKAYVAYEDEEFMVILDKAPVSFGHALVITREHYEAVQDVPPPTLARAWLIASAVARHLRVNRKAPGVNVLTNSGSAAGQVVFHFHIHVIPRWEEAFRRGVRHDLTEDEALRALELYSGLDNVIKEYLSGVR